MKKGFLDGCSPVIEVDGCFLKGSFKGQLLVAVGKDRNNNMYPIAVVEAETKDFWTWFLEILVSDLGVHERSYRLTFISDRQKGLMPVLEVVLPMADHRICVRHLYVNFRDLEGHKGLALKEQLWAAATAYTQHEFTAHMEELKKLSKDAYEYLNKIDHSGWSRAWFNESPRCELLVNNICECFNSYILKARDKPILTLFKMIRKKLLRRYQVKREGIEKLTGRLCPRIVQKLEAIELDAMDCIATYAGDGMFKVTAPSNKQYVVDLRRRQCGCRQWEITGIPCPHAFAAVLYNCGNPEDYVDECYTIKRYKKAYVPIIYPMPSEEQWMKTRHDHLEPPRIRVTPRRPMRLRKRKAKTVKSCGSCGPSQLSTVVKDKEDLNSKNTASGSTTSPQAYIILKKGKGKVQPTHAPRGSLIPSLVDEREHTPPPEFGPERGVRPPPVED
ncbi:uncharacterized protein LOC132169463 [Corylus avellana]|uniref:uncharacterized protein LOC132169463 n=1 Tax=Corylus avellana TaxID=13451 RepID=UPI00286A05BF|nr:uncharacterized protein LOC132169463 [Corylus avellana]